MGPASKWSPWWALPVSAGSCRWNPAVRERVGKAARTRGKTENRAIELWARL
jgi:hypothetical protein